MTPLSNTPFEFLSITNLKKPLLFSLVTCMVPFESLDNALLEGAVTHGDEIVCEGQYLLLHIGAKAVFPSHIPQSRPILQYVYPQGRHSSVQPYLSGKLVALNPVASAGAVPPIVPEHDGALDAVVALKAAYQVVQLHSEAGGNSCHVEWLCPEQTFQSDVYTQSGRLQGQRVQEVVSCTFDLSAVSSGMGV